MADDTSPKLTDEDLAARERLRRAVIERDKVPMSERRMVDTPDKYDFPIGIITEEERRRVRDNPWEVLGDTKVEAFNGSSVVWCWIRWSSHRTQRLYRVDMSGPDRDYAAEAGDLFDALVWIRRELDPTGWRLGVNGARRDTYPSAMDRDQGGGAVVRVIGAGPDGILRAPLGTFDEAPADLLATVEEQRQNFDDSGGDG